MKKSGANKMTAISAAMQRVGLSQNEVEFTVAVAKFQNNGGSFADYVRIGRAAYQVSGEGQGPHAPTGHVLVADAGTPMAPLQEQFNPSGAGQTGLASHRHTTRSLPAREPSHADIAAMVRVRQQSALSVLDSFKIRDGRAIGDVRF